MSGIDEIRRTRDDDLLSVLSRVEYVGEDSVVYQLLDDAKKLSEYLKDEITRGRVSLGFIRAIMPFGIDMYDENHAKFPAYYYRTLALMVQEMLINNLQLDLKTPWGREISQDVMQNA